MSKSLQDLTSPTNAPEKEESEREKNIQLVLEKLFSDEKMVFKADLMRKNKFWLHMTRLKTIAEHYDLKVAGEFHEQILEHSVSIERKGRGEFIKMFQTLHDAEKDREQEEELKKTKKWFG